jgi:hypothetical protein
MQQWFGGSRGDRIQAISSSWLWGIGSGRTRPIELLQLSIKLFIFTGLRLVGIDSYEFPPDRQAFDVMRNHKMTDNHVWTI